MTLSNFAIAFTVYFCIAYGCGALMVRKGRNCVLGFFLAFLLGPLGVAIVLMYPSAFRPVRLRTAREHSPGADARANPQQGGSVAAAVGTRTCHFCKMSVPTDASFCRVCQMEIDHHAGAAEAVA